MDAGWMTQQPLRVKAPGGGGSQTMCIKPNGKAGTD